VQETNSTYLLEYPDTFLLKYTVRIHKTISMAQSSRITLVLLGLLYTVRATERGRSAVSRLETERESISSFIVRFIIDITVYAPSVVSFPEIQHHLHWSSCHYHVS
jgi:hypothetical protein